MKAIKLTFILILSFTEIYAQNSDWAYRNPNPQNDFYAIKFFNQNTGYIIGSDGVLLKNTSGSGNWITIPTGTTRDLFAMYFFDINTGYIAGDSGIVLYTSTGGADWTSAAVNNGYALRSITFVNQNTGFAAGDHGGLFKTTNGINGWNASNVTTSRLRCVYFYDSLTGFICGDSGKFLKTTNCGSSWSLQAIGTENLYSVSFINALTGFIGRRFVPKKTTDGGNTWFDFQISYSGEESHIEFANANTGYLYGKNIPISRTTNGGLNWSIWCSSQIMSGNRFYDVSHIDSNTAYVCGAEGWILKCYGNSSQQYATHIGGSISPLSYLSFTNASTGAMMGYNSLLFTTSSGGDKWNITLSGYNNWFEGWSELIRLWLFTPTSWYREMYTPGIGGFSRYYIQQSTDGGLTWAGNRSYTAIGFGVNDVFEAGGLTYLTYNSQVYKNSGSGWNSVYNGPSVGCIHFANANMGFVAQNLNGSKVVLYTSNAGTNWVAYPTSSTKWIYSVFLGTSGLGFVGCDSALLLRTTNFGLNWTQIPVSNNLIVQNIRFVNDSTGWFMGTNQNYPETGRLFVSTVGGTFFQQMQSLESFNVKGFSFVDAHTGYVCGDSGKVLKTTNGGLTFFEPVNSKIPAAFYLGQNYPNPFNPQTKIKFALPPSPGGEGSGVRLVIYDILGREITSLVNEKLSPGIYEVTWDATNYPSGVYFYRMTAGDYTETKKMMLSK